MTKYNWNERHIITFPEEKLALATRPSCLLWSKRSYQGN